MFAIKNVECSKFARHTGETINNEGYQYVEYPWELVDDINEASTYETLVHANEIAFWHLDYSQEWVVVNVTTGAEYKKKLGKYLPV